MSFVIPDGLQRLNNTESGNAWIKEIPKKLSELSIKWDLDIKEPYSNGTVSYVTAAKRGEEDVVLKLQWPHEDCRYEADALEKWNGNGAVRLLEHDKQNNALLIELCLPGGTLGNSALSDKLGPAIHLLSSLWIKTDYPFQILKDEAARWRQTLHEKWERAEQPFEKYLVDLAVQYIDELANTQGDQVLVHQDLHADNIVAATREPWLSIDPKPIIGEREFSVVPLVRSFELGHSYSDVIGRLDRLCSELNLNRERALKWTIVHTVAWNVGGVSFVEHLETIRWLARESNS